MCLGWKSHIGSNPLVVQDAGLVNKSSFLLAPNVCVGEQPVSACRHGRAMVVWIDDGARSLAEAESGQDLERSY